MDDETLGILLEAHAEGVDAIKDVSEAIHDLETRMLQLIVVTAGVMEATLANSAAMRESADSTDKAGRSAGGAGIGVGFLGTAFLQLGLGAQVALISIGLLAGPLAPFGAVVFGITAAILGMTIGILGAAAAVAIAVAPFAIFLGLMVMLSNLNFANQQQAIKDQITSLTQAKDVLVSTGDWTKQNQADFVAQTAALNAQLLALEDPLQSVKDGFSQMAATLGTAAAPSVKIMADAFAGLLPGITAAGVAIIHWFQAQLPDALKLLTPAIHAMGGAADVMAVSWTRFFLQMEERIPALGPIATQGLSVITGAFEGLLNNLLRLTDWFTKTEPAMAPIAGAGFSAIGQFIQNLASTGANVVNWFIANWPEITLVAKQVWDDIEKGWNGAKPVWDAMLATWGAAKPILQDLATHGDQVHQVIVALGAVALIILSVVGWVALLALGVVDLVIKLMQLVDWITRVGAQGLYWFGQLALAMNPVIQAIESALGWLQALIKFIQDHSNQHINVHVDQVNSVSGPSLNAPGGTQGALPVLDAGGIIPGVRGQPVLMIGHAGEEVIPLGGSRSSGRSKARGR